MKQIVTRIQKISLGIFTAIFVASFFVSVIPAQSVFAVAANDSSTNPDDWLPKTRAKRWAYLTAMYHCSEDAWSGANSWNDGINNDRIDADNAAKGNWFYDPIGLDRVNHAAGYIDIQTKDNGKADCNDVVNSLASTYGISQIELLCKLGGSRQDGSDCPESGTGSKFKPPNTGDRMDLTSVWGSKDLPQDAGATAYYELNLAALMADKGCNLSEKAGATGDYAYTLKIVDATGVITDKTYTGQKHDHKINVYNSYPGLNDQERSCATIAGDLAKLATDYATWVKGHQESAGAPDQSGGGGTAEPTSCAVDGIGWIICPVMNFMAKVNDSAFKFLQSFLTVRPSLLTNKGTQNAWSAFRDIANVAFVIAFLVIVYSQLTSAGVSNYGIKKMLPRIVVAAILVNVSFYVCELAVDVSNIVGSSVYSLLKDSINIGGGIQNATWEDKTVGILAAAGGAAGIILLAILVIMAPTSLLAFAVIILILVARQAFVILLVVMSPLAFVAYLLPNTESWFKKWWKAFSAVLMVYPIIGVVFGVSTLASNILSSTAANTDDANIMQLIALGVLAVPLFAVPSLLKGSLSAAGSLGQRLATLSDRTNRMAANQGKERRKDFANRLNIAAQDPDNKWGRRLGGGARYLNRRKMVRQDREAAASRAAQLGYANDMIATDSEGNLTERAKKMQMAAAGGVGAANQKGRVRAQAVATQRTFKQFDEDVSAFQTTQTSKRHDELVAIQTDANRSIEERAAAAGTVASRDYRAGHNDSLAKMHEQMQQADDELLQADAEHKAAVTRGSGVEAAKSKLDQATANVATQEAIQKQFKAQWKDKSFGMGDAAMGELGEGKYGRDVMQYDENGQEVGRRRQNNIYDDTRVRAETKLNEQTLVTMNPDDLTIVVKSAEAEVGSGEELTDSQLSFVVQKIAAARANRETNKFIKKEASDKFDRIIAKAQERGLASPTESDPSSQTGPPPEPSSESIISGGPDGLN